MLIQGHPLSEIITALLVILWGIIRFIGIGVLIAGGIYLIMQSLLLFVFFITVSAIATMKVKL